MLAKLQKLATHLENLDSGSGEAKAIRWALAEIERLSDELADAKAALYDLQLES